MSESSSVRIDSAKDLDAYKVAYDLAMRIFEVTRKFPSEEKYALTSQIRRSSRSICLNLREALAKRRYEAHFLSKLHRLRWGERGNRFSPRFRKIMWLQLARRTSGLDRHVCRNRPNAWWYYEKVWIVPDSHLMHVCAFRPRSSDF